MSDNQRLVKGTTSKTKKKSVLEQYTDDLTEAAKRNPNNFKAIARDQEMRQVEYNLARKTKNNPILIGDAGVGKTAIVEGLARNIALGKVGPQLAGKHIRVLQIANLGRDDPIGIFLKIIEEVKASHRQIILFIDEIHTIMGVDHANGALDLGDVLKPAMARGEIQLIGSTTLDEYYKFIERDPALQRRFQQVNVEEPTPETAITILKGIQKNYEDYHDVTYTDAAVKGAVNLSVRYIADRYLPDKAIDLLDQAGAIAATKKQKVVDLKDIALVLQEMRGIPVTTVLSNDSERLRKLPGNLRKLVKGQDRAINEVSNAIAIAKAGLQSPNRPLASFLFLGTTGTGKTALALALSYYLFDSYRSLVRFDMSEFSERDSIEHFQHMVTQTLKKQPYCILLLDEIEKSCTPVHDRLLQILDAGELRDSRGRSTNFRNCIIIMTTNLAAELIADRQSYQASVKAIKVVNKYSKLDDEDSLLTLERRQKAFRQLIQDELTTIFRPEFVNRIDHKIVFNMLTRNIILQIANHDLQVLNKRLASRGFKFEYGNDVLNYLADVGTDIENGARPLERKINEEFTSIISMDVLQLESDPNNNRHRIKASIIDNRNEYQRMPQQRHNKNGRQIKWSLLPDEESVLNG